MAVLIRITHNLGKSGALLPSLTLKNGIILVDGQYAPINLRTYVIYIYRFINLSNSGIIKPKRNSSCILVSFILSFFNILYGTYTYLGTEIIYFE